MIEPLEKLRLGRNYASDNKERTFLIPVLVYYGSDLGSTAVSLKSSLQHSAKAVGQSKLSTDELVRGAVAYMTDAYSGYGAPEFPCDGYVAATLHSVESDMTAKLEMLQHRRKSARSVLLSYSSRIVGESGQSAVVKRLALGGVKDIRSHGVTLETPEGVRFYPNSSILGIARDAIDNRYLSALRVVFTPQKRGGALVHIYGASYSSPSVIEPASPTETQALRQRLRRERAALARPEPLAWSTDALLPPKPLPTLEEELIELLGKTVKLTFYSDRDRRRIDHTQYGRLESFNLGSRFSVATAGGLLTKDWRAENVSVEAL